MSQQDTAARPDRIAKYRAHRVLRGSLPRSSHEHRRKVVCPDNANLSEMPDVAGYAGSAAGKVSRIDADQGCQVGEPRVYLQGVQRDLGKWPFEHPRSLLWTSIPVDRGIHIDFNLDLLLRIAEGHHHMSEVLLFCDPPSAKEVGGISAKSARHHSGVDSLQSFQRSQEMQVYGHRVLRIHGAPRCAPVVPARACGRLPSCSCR